MSSSLVCGRHVSQPWKSEPGRSIGALISASSWESMSCAFEPTVCVRGLCNTHEVCDLIGMLQSRMICVEGRYIKGFEPTSSKKCPITGFKALVPAREAC